MSDNFGHMIVRPGGYRCSCGRVGCLETQCSETALYSRLGYSNIQEFFEALKKGDERCVTRWEEYMDDLCTALNNLYMAYDMDLVIGGSMSQYLEQYRDKIEQRVFRDYSLFPVRKKLVFVHEGEYAAAIGAAAVVIEKFVARKIS